MQKRAIRRVRDGCAIRLRTAARWSRAAVDPYLHGAGQYAYGTASVDGFRVYAERVSGKPPAAFFETSLHQPSQPSAPAARSASFTREAEGAVPPRSGKKIAATNGVHGHSDAARDPPRHQD